MATLMLENGADIRYIQQMLGHARLETTEVYTHISILKLKEIHTATHPARLDRAGAAPAAGDLRSHRPGPAAKCQALGRSTDPTGRQCG